MYPSQKIFILPPKRFTWKNSFVSRKKNFSLRRIIFFTDRLNKEFSRQNSFFWRFVENESGRKKISLSLTQKKTHTHKYSNKYSWFLLKKEKSLKKIRFHKQRFSRRLFLKIYKYFFPPAKMFKNNSSWFFCM